MSARVTAQDALDEARDAKGQISAHERECALRYEGISKDLTELKGLAKWAAGGVLGIIVSLAAWMAVQLYSLNNARLDALEAPAVVHSGVR